MALVEPPVRRALLAVFAIVIFILLAGATYQGVATTFERREFSRPGGLVSVGDHQLHIYCTGKGSPTVVLEAPAAGMSSAWGDVQRRLSGTTRVCSYDRAGLGWSERGDLPFDPARVPDELHTLLKSANEHGPFVVAGQGLGAAYARIYASRSDSAAAVLVMIDSPEHSEESSPPGWIVPASPWLARTGVLRAGRMMSSKADGLANGGAVKAFLNRPDHLSRAADEVHDWNAIVQRAAEAQPAATTSVVTVDLGSSDRIAFLTNPAAVDRVVGALEVAIANVRAKR